MLLPDSPEPGWNVSERIMTSKIGGYVRFRKIKIKKKPSPTTPHYPKIAASNGPNLPATQRKAAFEATCNNFEHEVSYSPSSRILHSRLNFL